MHRFISYYKIFSSSQRLHYFDFTKKYNKLLFYFSEIKNKYFIIIFFVKCRKKWVYFFSNRTLYLYKVLTWVSILFSPRKVNFDYWVPLSPARHTSKGFGNRNIFSDISKKLWNWFFLYYTKISWNQFHEYFCLCSCGIKKFFQKKVDFSLRGT